MELVNGTDKDGNVLKLQQFRGVLLPPMLPMVKGYEVLLNLQARDDDVILCGYPKCGSHWMTQVVWMILSGSTDCMKAPTTIFLEYVIPIADGDMSSYDEAPSPRIMMTHLPHDMLPPDFRKKKTKLLYLCRNPKDVAVSYYNLITKSSFLGYQGSWDAYLGLFLDGHIPFTTGSIFDELERWQTTMNENPETPILIVYYEDTKEDFMKQARRLCEFFNISRDDEFLSAVRTACSFEKMKEFADKSVPSGTNAPKITSLMYRKGEVGDWKNWFTVAQNESFDEICRNKLKDLKYEFKYDL